jgi:hypothetical protein
VRGYKSYLKYYISNIQELYPEALTIVVDNNSKYKDDIYDTLQDLDKVVLLENDIDSKFELGAYTEGVRHLSNKDLINKYEYFIFTQDTYILKNKYDFTKHKDKACPISAAVHGADLATLKYDKVQGFTKITPPHHVIKQVWCSSFVLHSSKVLSFFEILKDIKVITRADSEDAERYISAVLYYLNDNKISDIDSDGRYSPWTDDPLRIEVDNYFMKKLQQKTENTKD